MKNLRYERLPAGLRGGMERYIEQGVPPGCFLTAVLTNDLCEACSRADDINRDLLWEIVGWLWNEAPASCWGSPERVSEWLAAAARRRATKAAGG
jgi:hypothetical protein